jgi:hypothetical protein
MKRSNEEVGLEPSTPKKTKHDGTSETTLIKTVNKTNSKTSVKQGKAFESDEPSVQVEPTIKTAIENLSMKRSESKDCWLRVLLFLKNCGSQYKKLANDFSQKSSKYLEQDFEKTWTGIKSEKNQQDPITLGTVYRWIQEDTKFERTTTNGTTIIATTTRGVDHLTAQFNDSIKNKYLIVCNEHKVSEKQLDTLKMYITDNPITLTEKYRNTGSMGNYGHYGFASNHEEPFENINVGGQPRFVLSDPAINTREKTQGAIGPNFTRISRQTLRRRSHVFCWHVHLMESRFEIGQRVDITKR